MFPIDPTFAGVAVFGVVLLVLGLAQGGKGLPQVSLPSLPTTTTAKPATTAMNREEYAADDPADLILLAATKLSKAGASELAAKALALSQEARRPGENA